MVRLQRQTFLQLAFRLGEQPLFKASEPELVRDQGVARVELPRAHQGDLGPRGLTSLALRESLLIERVRRRSQTRRPLELCGRLGGTPNLAIGATQQQVHALGPPPPPPARSPVRAPPRTPA